MSTWELGREFVLRHTGMPFDWIEGLGDDPGLEQAATRLAAAETAVRDALDGQPPARVRAVETALHTLAGPPAAPDGRLRRALGEWSEAVDRYRLAYWDGYTRIEARLHTAACEPLVQEAVFVSNPDMWENMWRRYATASERGTNAAQRRLQRQVYTYLQRLCGKNETTSFFGPLAYGTVDEKHETGCTLRRDVPVRRLVFFAQWAVAALVRAVRRDRGVLPLLPVSVVDPDRLRARLGTGAGGDLPDLPDRLARLLLRDGSVPVGRLAAELGVGVAQVMRLLRDMLASNTVELGPSYPGDRQDAFDRLRDAVAGLGGADPDAARWQGGFAALAALRDDLAAAPFPQRTEVFYRLEQTFTALTGQAARRDGGLYTDRFVVYEEASSPFALALGAGPTARLTDAVQEALDFCADYGALVRRRHQEHLLGRWPEHDRLTFDAYGEAMRPAADPGSAFDPNAALAVDPADLGDPVRRRELVAPAAPGPAYALPDICLAAADTAALDAGRFDVVIARVHHHLLLESWLSVAHPDPDAFGAAAARWVAESGTPQGLVGLDVSRRNKGFYVFPGDRVALRPLRADDAGDARLARAGDYHVHRADGRIVLVDRAGHERLLYLPLADLAAYPPLAALSAPQLVHARIEPPAVERTAAVTLGNAVYQRARWFVAMPDVAGLDPAARYLSLRRLAAARGMPRFVYIRSERRRKPYLLDTRSPLGAELLAHVTEAGERVQFEEMSPGPDALWLRDEEGRRYTCELRMQATRTGATTNRSVTAG
ncbi:lantibiotic dehydratase family protein [Kitasatospora sp. NBC_00085]|uniref:lantibiotic dehydratase n=1 Tax=unclassified Kitasatospora TaxID=2633591 RepID=UPI002F9085DA